MLVINLFIQTTKYALIFPSIFSPSPALLEIYVPSNTTFRHNGFMKKQNCRNDVHKTTYLFMISIVIAAMHPKLY